MTIWYDKILVTIFNFFPTATFDRTFQRDNFALTHALLLDTQCYTTSQDNCTRTATKRGAEWAQRPN